MVNDAFGRVASPCVQACCLDEQHVCTGCWRNLHEIKQWSVVNDAIREKFLANARQRKQAASDNANASINLCVEA